MKKVIAISVVFALLAVTAFAETSVGGNLKIGLSLLSGNDGGGDAQSGGLTVYDSHANVSFSDSNAGGMVRLWSIGKDGAQMDWTPAIFTFGWWKPIDQLRIQLGQNADGDFGHAQISGWGFNGEAQGGTSLDQHRGLGGSGFPVVARTTKAWYGGFSDLGAAISIYPVQGLTINWVIPFQSKAGGDLDSTFGRSHFGVVYGIPDIGTVRVAAKLTDPDASDLPVDFYGSFYLMAIDGLGVDIGVGYESEILGIGLGLRYTAGDFSVKLRFGVDLEDPDVALGVHILPSYSLGGAVIFLNAGMGMQGDGFSWYVNPYVRVPMGGGMSFYGGFQLWDTGNEVVNWAVPITYNFYF